MGTIGRRRLNSSTMVFSSRSLLTSLFLRVLYNQRIAVNFSVKLFSAVQLNEFFKAVGNHGWIYIREKKWVMEEIGCSRKWKWNLESNWVIVSFKFFRERVKFYMLPLDRGISLSKKSRLTCVEARLLTGMPRYLQDSYEHHDTSLCSLFCCILHIECCVWQ